MPRELRFVGRDPDDLLKLEPPFPRITYDEAVELLNEKGVEMLWGDDFGRTQEEPLSRSFDKPVWVVGFPSGIKPFYHMPNPENPDVTLSADLIAPEGYNEMGIGAAQRVRAGGGEGDHVDDQAGPHKGHDPLPEGREAGLPLASTLEDGSLPPVLGRGAFPLALKKKLETGWCATSEIALSKPSTPRSIVKTYQD